MQVF
jgi:MFS family permease